MSETDFLTGCLGKESIDGTLDKLHAECDIDKRPLSILSIDLDNFKSYNDKYGHMEGDEALKYFASTLRLSLGEEDPYIFRFGGDEFVLAFPGKSAKETYLIANGVMKNLRRRPFLYKGHIFRLSFSGGIASYPSNDNDVQAVLQKSDKAMYFSKTHGRKKTVLYSRMLHRAVGRILFISVSVLVAGGGFFYFQKSPYKATVMDWLKEKVDPTLATLVRKTVNVGSEGSDLVYLKSGRVLKGIIVRDDKDEIEISLNIESGKASVTVKRSEIRKIKKQPKKDE